jgi:uncharacterized short protein YbdD (DUF466 family)
MRQVADFLAHVAWVVRRVIGAPDYAAYVQHMRGKHPDVVPMSADEFARDRLARRYTGVGSRCC